MVQADRQEGGEGAALVGAAAAAYALIVRRWSACRGGVIAVDELVAKPEPHRVIAVDELGEGEDLGELAAAEVERLVAIAALVHGLDVVTESVIEGADVDKVVDVLEDRVGAVGREAPVRIYNTYLTETRDLTTVYVPRPVTGTN